MKNILRKMKRVIPSTDEYYSYSRNHYHERLSTKYGKVDSYIVILNNSNKLLPLESKIQIKPELGCSAEAAIAKFGEPFLRLTNITVLKNNIMLFKFMMGGHKTKCEMHFFKNKLFFFTYTFSYLTPNDKTNITELLSEKYLDKSVDLKNSRIIDQQGNGIFINDSSDFVVCYLASGADFFKEAESIRTREKDHGKIKLEISNKDLLNRL